LDVRGQKHKVCQKFWSKVYGISTKTIYKKLIKYSNSPLKINQPSQQRQWNRDKIWKNKVDEKNLFNRSMHKQKHSIISQEDWIKK
jgi:hypothetical protein